MSFHAFTEVSRARETYLHNLGEPSPRRLCSTAYRGGEPNLGEVPHRYTTWLTQPAVHEAFRISRPAAEAQG